MGFYLNKNQIKVVVFIWKLQKAIMADEAGSKKMSHTRKMTLKSLMLNKAKEDLEREAAAKAVEKKNVLAKRLKPLEALENMTVQEAQDLCRELHQKIDKVMDESYDLRSRVKKNDKEIDELNQQIFDLRGKFKRPPLRRVRMSADQMLKALLGSKHKVSMDLRSNLKTVSKSKEVKTEKDDMKDWRENIDAKAVMEGKMAMFQG